MAFPEICNKSKKKEWPEGKDFAFTIFDDTDLATLKNVQEVYALLTDLGFRTTKSVWPLRGNDKPQCGGETCDDPAYLNWVLKLKEAGFEIGFHNATFHSSLRADSIKGLQRFANLFSHYPRTAAQHMGCLESLYWGNYRLTGINALIYNMLTRFHNFKKYRGHIETDPYFWGDLCKENIKYMRNFVFPDLNTLKQCPFMPYHDPMRPYVNYWFASSEGATPRSFNRCLSEPHQDRLEAERGAAIMYTHFGAGFYRNGQIDGHFKFLMERLSRKNGWFVPVSVLLDFLIDCQGHHEITDRERQGLERKWLWNKMRMGFS
jgi:hypothetical protein